jgi:hypothetical protein
MKNYNLILINMVEIKDPSVHLRENDFVADEISFVNFVVRDYSNPQFPIPYEYAAASFDK